MINIKINGSSLYQTRNRLGQITKNVKVEGDKGAKKIGQIIAKSIANVIKRESYQGKNTRYGPARRATGKGMPEAMLTFSQSVVKIGEGQYLVRPPAGSLQEQYALPMEVGHTTPNKARPTNYFKKGRLEAQQLIRNEFDKIQKRIVTKK